MTRLFLGLRTRGKTMLALFLALQADLQIIFDPRRQFQRFIDTMREDGLGDTLLVARNTMEIAQCMAKLGQSNGPTMLIVMPDDDLDAAFQRLCRELKRFVLTRMVEKTPFALLVDESRLFTPQDSPEFKWLMRCTDNDSFQTLLTCHRPVDLVPEVRAIIERWYIFQTAHPADLRTLEEMIGENWALKVRALKPKQFLDWDGGIMEGRLRTDSDTWYVDAFGPRAADARAVASPKSTKPSQGELL